jgi:hypothetical protein
METVDEKAKAPAVETVDEKAKAPAVETVDEKAHAPAPADDNISRSSGLGICSTTFLISISFSFVLVVAIAVAVMYPPSSNADAVQPLQLQLQWLLKPLQLAATDANVLELPGADEEDSKWLDLLHRM